MLDKQGVLGATGGFDRRTAGDQEGKVASAEWNQLCDSAGASTGQNLVFFVRREAVANARRMASLCILTADAQ